MPRERLSRIEQDFRDAKNHLYGLAHNVCCNGGEQKALLERFHQMEIEMTQAGDSGQVIILRMLNVIHDGLAYGNWPWSPMTVDEIVGTK